MKLNDLGNTAVWPDEHFNFYECNAENTPLMVFLKSLVSSVPGYEISISISLLFTKAVGFHKYSS